MVMFLGAVVVGGVEVAEPVRAPRPENVTPLMTIDVEPTETTLPLAKLPPGKPRPVRPEGALPLEVLTGGVLPLEVPPGVRPANPPRKPPAPDAQLPDGGRGVTVTDRAVMVPPDEVPVTVTQSPAANDDRVTEAVLVNEVDPVQVTVV